MPGYTPCWRTSRLKGLLRRLSPSADLSLAVLWGRSSTGPGLPNLALNHPVKRREGT